MDVTLPDGTVIKGVPDGTSKEQLVGKLQAKGYDTSWYKPETAAPAQPQSALPKSRSLGEYVGETASNVLPSLGRLASDVGHAVIHPIDTATGVLDIAAGGLRRALPKSVSSFIDKASTPEEIANIEQKSGDVGEFYKQRYGGIQNVLDTLRTDPVGMLGDATAVLGGGGAVLKGGAAASRAAGAGNLATKLGNLGEVASTVGTKFDPVVRTASLGADVLGAAGTGAKNLFGTVSNLGTENLEQAYKAGRSGDTTFRDHMHGKADSDATVTMAKDNVETMRQQMRDNYANAQGGWANDTTTLNFAPIDQALSNVKNSLQYNGKWKIGDAEKATIGKLESVIDEWRQDPAAHTVDGLDALKQAVSSVYPESPAHRQSQRAVTEVQNAVRDTIINQAPQYADAMKDYWGRASQLDEIEKTLSLGDKSTVDTAVRKLQSTEGPKNMRRSELLDQMEQGGGIPIRPALAGQALSGFEPRLRGLGGLGAGALGGAGLITGNPMMIAAALSSSPRIAGEVLHAAGRVAGSPVGKTIRGAAGKFPAYLRASSIATPLSNDRVESFLKELRKEQ